MSDAVIVALVAVTALLLNYRGFAAINSRFASLDERFPWIGTQLTSLEHRLELIENKLEALATKVSEIDRRLALHEDWERILVDRFEMLVHQVCVESSNGQNHRPVADSLSLPRVK
jgi:hypothetical protein